jgi:hypothetical protein
MDKTGIGHESGHTDQKRGILHCPEAITTGLVIRKPGRTGAKPNQQSGRLLGDSLAGTLDPA